jgi:hypothetical protein
MRAQYENLPAYFNAVEMSNDVVIRRTVMYVEDVMGDVMINGSKFNYDVISDVYTVKHRTIMLLEIAPINEEMTTLDSVIEAVIAASYVHETDISTTARWIYSKAVKNQKYLMALCAMEELKAYSERLDFDNLRRDVRDNVYTKEQYTLAISRMEIHQMVPRTVIEMFKTIIGPVPPGWDGASSLRFDRGY